MKSRIVTGNFVLYYEEIKDEKGEFELWVKVHTVKGDKEHLPHGYVMGFSCLQYNPAQVERTVKRATGREH